MAPKLHRLAFLAVFLTSAVSAEQTDERRLKVAFVIWDGMELIEIMGPGHVFAFAPGMDEFTVSATRDPIKSEFFTVVPEYTFDDCPRPDVIVLPGGSIWTPMTGEPFRAWLKEQVPRTTLTLTVCNGAVLLADLGLLNGRKATCGPGNLDDLMLLGKDVQAYANRRWVHDGNVITSQSYLGGMDAAFYAVQVLRGDEGLQQVLRWSNYRVDFSQFAREHAEPGIVPTSRRREIVAILQREGVDAAVRRYQEWVVSGAPAYSPPLDTFDERDMFQWMAWGNQRLGRHDLSLKICEFKARVWPESARERAYLGEALMKTGQLEPALARLLEALDLDHECRPAIAFLKELVSRPDCPMNESSRRAKSVLAERANHTAPGASSPPASPPAP